MFEYKYARPSVTVDILIFTIHRGVLKVLLVERDPENLEDPYRGMWAFPGGHVNSHPDLSRCESPKDAAIRELGEETSLEVDKVGGIYLEQLYTFGEPGRDSRGHVISVAYYALVRPELMSKVKAGDDATDAKWEDATKIRGLAFDHDKILKVALERIRGGVDYKPDLIRSMLPELFSQTNYRKVLDILKDEKHDRGNFGRWFRSKIKEGLIIQTEIPSPNRKTSFLYKFP